MELESGLGGTRRTRGAIATVALTALLAGGCGSETPAAPPSPATVAEGEGVLGEWVSSGGLQRTYALHVPPGCDGSRPCPLILAFHGAGGSHQFAQNDGLFRAADRGGFVVAAPDGVGGDWALRCGGCTLADQLGIDDVHFVDTLVSHLSRHLSIDRSRIYAAGRSDGGTFTYRLACEYPLAGAGVVAGTMLNPQLCRPSRAVSVIAFHGSADTVIPFFQGSVPVAQWADLDGCAPTPTLTPLPDPVDDGTRVTRYDYPGCREGAEVSLFAIEGGGHNWPGSPTPSSAGRQTRDIEASEEMVDFFARHALSATNGN